MEIRVAKRIQEDYVAPKSKTFGGAGQRLGGVVPGDSDNSGGSTSMPGSFPAGRTAAREPSEAQKPSFISKFEVDQSQPMTSIQIRLADGTRYVLIRQTDFGKLTFMGGGLSFRIVARMNLIHTVGDIRNFINAYASFRPNLWFIFRVFNLAV